MKKFYSDKEYRRRLVSSSSAAGSYYFPSYSSEYFELENIHKQDRKLKEKLNLPENCTIRYEKVRCCKGCRHEHLYALHNYNFLRKYLLYAKTNIHPILTEEAIAMLNTFWEKLKADGIATNRTFDTIYIYIE